MPRMGIGDRLRALRRKKAASMPGKRLGIRGPADAAGVSAETYRQWELDPSRKIADEHIAALARYFGTTPQYIRYGGDPHQQPALDTKALEAAITMMDVVLSSLGASLPPAKRALVLRQLYERATAGGLDRRVAEDIIALAL